MTLREKRCLFSKLISALVLELIEHGLEVAYDEVTERITAKDPTSDHMKNSLHHLGIAADLLLYESGKYLEKTEDYKLAGMLWKKKHELCRWGGDFNDGNHFSLEHEGRK